MEDLTLRAGRCRSRLIAIPLGVGMTLVWLSGAQFGLAQAVDQANATQLPQAGALDTSQVPEGANWVVLDANGSARWRGRESTPWQAFKRGEVLPPGSVIETGPDGHVILVTGGDELLVGPSSRLSVPEIGPGGAPLLRHERGRLLVHIESRRGRDFRVRTPLLSMGIKGTRFETAVDGDQDRVLVLDGEVAVQTPGSEEATELGPGEGLAQPVAPGAPATRFERPVPDAAQRREAEPVWLLPGTATTAPSSRIAPADPARIAPTDPAPTAPRDSAAQLAPGEPAALSPDRATKPRAGPAKGVRSGRGEEQPWFGQVDEWLGTGILPPVLLALAAGALVLLILPGLALLQALRDHWLGRSRRSGKGLQRNSLLHGP